MKREPRKVVKMVALMVIIYISMVLAVDMCCCALRKFRSKQHFSFNDGSALLFEALSEPAQLEEVRSI